MYKIRCSHIRSMNISFINRHNRRSPKPLLQPFSFELSVVLVCYVLYYAVFELTQQLPLFVINQLSIYECQCQSRCFS
jgi:hypothetical protein